MLHRGQQLPRAFQTLAPPSGFLRADLSGTILAN